MREEDDSDDRGISILLHRVKRKVKTYVNGTSPEINISLDFKGIVDETDLNYRLDQSKDKKTLEEKISALIKKDCIKLLEYSFFHLFTCFGLVTHNNNVFILFLIPVNVKFLQRF